MKAKQPDAKVEFMELDLASFDSGAGPSGTTLPRSRAAAWVMVA